MEYRMVYDPDDVTLVGSVVFRMAEPADEHEAMVRLRMSAASWISQGTPREITLSMTAPVTSDG
jgi:hypothetical protein